MTTVASGLEEVAALAGRDLGVTEWVEITQDRVNAFADATGDHQWIHVDPERAAAGPFGGTIAHGYLTLALLIPLYEQLLSVSGVGMSINYGLGRVRFPAPVPVGGRIRLAAKIVEAEMVTGPAVQVQVEFTVELHGADKPACIAQAIYRYYA
jgi:acyl dehydratase